MSGMLRRLAALYSSDGSFTAGFLLALGLLGPTAGLWLRHLPG
jgi:hypothetical protein